MDTMNSVSSVYETANKPFTRCGHVGVEYSGLLYVFGGYHEAIDEEIKRNKITNQVIDVNIYNPETSEFEYNTAKASKCAPLLRYGHTCVLYNSLVYLWGGQIYPSELTDRNGDSNLYCYESKGNTWSIVSTQNMPHSRNGHSACVIGDAMYVFGGYVHKHYKCCNNLYKFDFLSNIWMTIDLQADPSVPQPRFLHTATAIGSSFYVYGGRCYDQNMKVHKPYNSTSSEAIHKYDTTTNKWSVFAYLPIGSRAHSAVAFKNKIFIFGGYYQCDYQNSLFIFDTDLKSLEVKLEQLIPRGKHICCLVNDKLYLIGGTGHLNSSNNDNDGDGVISQFLYNFDIKCMYDELESNKENIDENLLLAFRNFIKSYESNEKDDEFVSLEILNELGCHYVSKIEVIHL